MNPKKYVSSLIAVAAISTVAAFALADENKGPEPDLGHYYPIRAALAQDKLDGVKDQAAELAKSPDSGVAKAAQALAKAEDLTTARRGFGDLTKALLAELDAATKKGAKLGLVYVFQCPMAKPYGKWVQETNEIGNPYMGQGMLTCGKMIGSIGAPAEEGKKPAKGGGGCCGGGEGDGGCCGGKKKGDANK